MGKAQVGMEYLITYGWAIIVVGVVVLLLLSLRVFDVNWFSVRNEVFGLGTFAVPDFRVVPDGAGSRVLFYLVNNNRYELNLTDIKIGDAPIGLGPGVGNIILMNGTSIDAIPGAGGFKLDSGERIIVNCSTPTIPNEINTVFSVKIAIHFSTKYGGLHSETGLLRGRIEPP